MHIFIAALGAETNSFVNVPTSLEDFAASCLVRPHETTSIVIANDGQSEFIRLAQAHDCELTVGTLAYAQPSGPVLSSTYETLRDEICEQLRAARDVDLVLLNLHGAMIAQDYPDCEGDLLEAIRKIVGPDVIVAALLDPHAHLSEKMISQADLLMAYHEYPHIDFAIRARELFALALQSVNGEVDPVMQIFDCQCIGNYPTPSGAMRAFVDQHLRPDPTHNILDCSLIHSFPWGDCADMGTKVLVIGNQDAAVARAHAGKIGKTFQSIFSAAHQVPASVDQVLPLVEQANDQPLVVGDLSDNPGGGAPGDSTFLLEFLLGSEVDNAAIGALCDPISVSIASKAGPGSTVNLRIGGKVSNFSGPPLDITATVIGVRFNAQDRFGEGADVRTIDIGPCVAVRTGGLDILLRATTGQTYSPLCFEQLGIELATKKLVVVKSSNHFKSAFRDVSDHMITVMTPGALNLDFHELPFQNRTHPLYPIEPVEAFL